MVFFFFFALCPNNLIQWRNQGGREWGLGGFSPPRPSRLENLTPSTSVLNVFWTSRVSKGGGAEGAGEFSSCK